MIGKRTAFIHQAAFLLNANKFSSPSSSSRRPVFATADEATKSTGRSGLNISKYKSQRSLISSDKRDVTAVEVNNLMVKAGKEVRINSLSKQSATAVVHCNFSSLTSQILLVFCLTCSFCIKKKRDIEKWKRALKGSFLVVFARLVSDGKLVGFARATSDKSLNGTIWDVVADPSLPDQVSTCISPSPMTRSACPLPDLLLSLY